MEANLSSAFIRQDQIIWVRGRGIPEFLSTQSAVLEADQDDPSTHVHAYTQLQKMSRISPAKPYLKQLLHIDISDIEPTFELFHAILEQPTVATVRVCNSTSLPTGSHRLDMSKVVLSCEVLDPIHSQLALDEHLLRGLTVAKVELHKVAFFDERLYGLTGLEEIELMGMNPDSCQGLLDLMSVNPHLRKISLMDKAYDANLSASFIQSFLDEIHWQSLSQHFRIPQIGLGRHPSQEWRITDLTIVATFASHPLIQVLPAIASFSPPSKSCPWIWGLSARVVWTWYGSQYDGIVPVLRRFHSLRTLHLKYLFGRLRFEGKQPWQRPRSPVRGTPIETLGTNAEAGGFDIRAGPSRRLRGWIYVVNAKRQIDGKLDNRYHFPERW
ncbi:hypothetical protein D9757_003271 [Collybiopsis confluens]|uniref:Uncharacterized protein n=1 Tax=Collybiopsis confluens TaxID=2823264 RepID=A0A8H5HYQ7_9AGAR|nr:hypothetical protein D9757_003271 [Collybiopsis confluens]